MVTTAFFPIFRSALVGVYFGSKNMDMTGRMENNANKLDKKKIRICRNKFLITKLTTAVNMPAKQNQMDTKDPGVRISKRNEIKLMNVQNHHIFSPLFLIRKKLYKKDPQTKQKIVKFTSLFF